MLVAASGTRAKTLLEAKHPGIGLFDGVHIPANLLANPQENDAQPGTANS